MSGIALIGEAKAHGLTLAMEGQKIAWESTNPPPEDLLAKLARNRVAVIAALGDQIAITGLGANERELVDAWLDHIDETDEAARAWVLERCAADGPTLDWVLAEARNVGLSHAPQSEPSAPSMAPQVKPSPLEPIEDLPLLPEDRAFLKALLNGKSAPIKQQLLDGYRQLWIEASSSELLKHRRDNAGRRAANTWIRQRDAKQ